MDLIDETLVTFIKKGEIYQEKYKNFHRYIGTGNFDGIVERIIRHVLSTTSQMSVSSNDGCIDNKSKINKLTTLADIKANENRNRICLLCRIPAETTESCCSCSQRYDASEMVRQSMKRRRRTSFMLLSDNNVHQVGSYKQIVKRTPITTTCEAPNLTTNNSSRDLTTTTTTATNETTFLHNCKSKGEVTVATLPATTTTTTTTRILPYNIHDSCCWRHCRRKQQNDYNLLEMRRHTYNSLEQQQQETPAHAAHAADAINATASNNKSDNRNQKINNIAATTTIARIISAKSLTTTMLGTTAATITTTTTPTTTPTTPTPTTKKTSSNANSNKTNCNNFTKLKNYFNILQFLIFFIQIQVLPYCCNIFKRQQQQQQQQQPQQQQYEERATYLLQNFAALLATTSIITTTTTRLSVSRNNYFNLSQQHQLQQHKTISPQLSKQVNCATTTITTKTLKETEAQRMSTTRNSEEHQRRQRQQQQQHHHFSNCQIENVVTKEKQHKEHNPHHHHHHHTYKQQQHQSHQKQQQHGMPKSNKYNNTRSKLFYIALLVLSFLTSTTSTIAAEIATTTTTTQTNSSSTIIMPRQMSHDEDQLFAESLRILTSAPPLASVSLMKRSETSAQMNKRNALDLNVSADKKKGEIKLSRNETLCKSMDIRNDLNSFKQLENCTAIEGFLLISLVNAKNLTETYPLLTEVTEYIVVYRVMELTSLSRIFPNLRVIRGKSLFDGYALVVYSNRDLQDIGLSKLRSIANGGVRIEKNLSLCFLKTVDWTQIVSTNTTDIVLKSNRDHKECPKCPGDSKAIEPQNGGDGGDGTDSLKCPKHQGQRYCWSGKACQTICPERCRNNCIDENTCCDEACLGGCTTKGDKKQCISCRHYAINDTTCIDKCPPGYYTYLDRRCITAETCERIGTKFENTKHVPLVHYNGQCTTRCPTGYNKINSTCEKCHNQCEKICEGGTIDSLVRAKEYNGCTQIDGDKGLTISIKRGGPHLMETLEYGLGSIHTIRTHLKVHLTFGLFSLRFFRSLKEISGEKLYDEDFIFYVLENNDLEEIWAPNQIVQMRRGTVFFHFNAKLCYSTIDALRPMMINQNITKFSKKEVAIDSNGNKGSCNTERLNVTVVGVKSVAALVMIDNPIKFGDDRTFIGYQFYHMENPYRNATKHSNRACDDSWIVSDPLKEEKHMFYNLEPYKTYAFYAKTMTISSELRNAQSDIHYFQTKPSKPQYVRQLKAVANSSSQIKLSWIPPMYANGNLTNYYIRAVLYNRNSTLESRNYCKDPLKETFNKDDDSYSHPSSGKVNKPSQETAEDCKCDKEGTKGTSIFNTDNEAARQDEIEFENTLQNFVYVKDPNRNSHARLSGAKTADVDRLLHNNAGGVGEELNSSQSGVVGGRRGGSLKKRRSIVMDDEIGSDDGSSFLTRHMRSLSDEAGQQDDSDWNSITMSKWPMLNSNQTWNDTRMDSTGEYYIVYTDKLNATRTEVVLEKLKHFSMYTLGVVACREKIINDTLEECSEIMLIDKITLKLDNVDLAENLDAKLENTNNSRGNVRVHWNPPKRPNGAVVSYTISFEKQDQDTIEEHRCITDVEFRNLSNWFPLPNLSEGNYSIRVRTNSLAGEGLYTKRIFIEVPPTRLTGLVISLIIISVLIFFSLLAFMLFYVYIRKKRPPSDLTMFPDVNPLYISLQYIPDEWEIPRESIIQYSPLGRGSFGMVYEGVLKAFNNSTEDTPCAIKTVNENATDRERVNFLSEASVMKQFDTYHVVHLLGVCSRGQPALVVMELMKNGDLKSYLRAHRRDEWDDVISSYRERIGAGDAHFPREPPKLERIYQMAIEIADGMAYLAAKKFVHRDLAARNCMVAADLTVKIGDFGMTRDIYETDYYRKGTKGLLPVRWMPPESLRDGVYASSSDVFSYGVVLWEMVTLASQPYQGLSNDQVLRYVIDGGVMERPENCPDRLYYLMQKCWHHRPNARPSFMDIINILMDVADPKFGEISFYHSEEGQQTLKKDNAERGQRGGEPYQDGDNELDDATTPLRVGEYPRYKLNMDNNSSVEQTGDSPMAGNDEHPNSPYSLHSAFIVSSTPDRQSKNSYNLSHNNPALGSGPSTSAGIGSGLLTQQLQRPYYGRTATTSQGEDDAAAAAYVLPDMDALYTATPDAQHTATPVTDERGYELYDPSPNNDKMSAYESTELDDLPTSGKLSGEQHLLPRSRGGQRGMPSIMPMSSSVPDSVIGAPMSSSLHPSTASAASSNASSTAAGTGRYSSLKRAVAETIAYVPSRLNRHILNHKRSGSNTSHKSTSSNPNTYGSGSVIGGGGGASGAAAGRDAGGTTSSGCGKSLSTIESGGSGSAGSYTATPRFFSSSATATGTTTATTKPATGVTISDNPNYQLLDESKNITGLSTTITPSSTSASLPSSSATVKKSKPTSPASGAVNYKLLNESFNTTANAPTPPLAATMTSSDNPNYELMQAPGNTQTSINPNYVPMNEPAAGKSTGGNAATNISENPNYQLMGPSPSPAITTTTKPTQPTTSGNFYKLSSTLSSALRRDQSVERLDNSSTTTSEASSSNEEPDDMDDDVHTVQIKMERMPLSQKARTQRGKQASATSAKQRSRSASQTRKPTKPSTTTTASSPITTTPSQHQQQQQTQQQQQQQQLQQQQQQQQQQGQLPSQSQTLANTLATREKWLLEPPRPPPPNGFIGREA